MLQHNARVLWNEKVSDTCRKIGLSGTRIYQEAVPGQFVMLRIPNGTVPLLRRPFSIHRRFDRPDGDVAVEVLYKVVGEGTRALSRCKAGDFLDMLGPLGRGFRVREKFRHIYIAAGGIGVAPMLFLAEFFLEKKFEVSGVKLFLGGRTAGDLLCEDAFADLGIPVHITTDDGSRGEQGIVTQPLEEAMDNRLPDILYACGPPGMLKGVAGTAGARAIACQISIETMMACGMGACLGCAVEQKSAPDKYLHACMDGPVFDAGKIRLPH